MIYTNSQKIEILTRLDIVLDTIKNRFLPTFDRISDEANTIYEQTLEKSSEFFNPETMDESSFFDEAMSEASYFYTLQNEMKQEFLNHQSTLVYHIFELDCKKMFPLTYSNCMVLEQELSKLGIDISNVSNWYKINTELRLINNVIKHGKGRSYNQLKPLKANLFSNDFNFLITSELKLTIIDIENYINYIKNFWIEFFDKVIK